MSSIETTGGRGERRGRRPARASGDIAQLPFKQPRNRLAPVELVSADELESIHEASLTILEEIGTLTPADRVLVIEDMQELLLDSANSLSMLATTEFDQLKCLKVALRLKPDRIIVGEVRDGAAALPLLKAWNTGPLLFEELAHAIHVRISERDQPDSPSAHVDHLRSGNRLEKRLNGGEQFR